MSIGKLDIPAEARGEVASKLKGAHERVTNLTMEDRHYLDNPEQADGRVRYDANNNPYQVDGETEMFDDVTADVHGDDVVITFHFADGPGHWFDNTSYANDVYEEMARGGVSKPRGDPEIGVQVRGSDVYVQNIIRGAVE